MCVADGADWVYWGDDDDPPHLQTFEKLFSLIDEIDDVSKTAQVGLVGTLFNNMKGEFRRFTDSELKGKKILEVDSIAGNQSKIVNKMVIQSGAMPCENLFFGFEELDFDLKAKELGFKSYINGTLNFELRKKYKKDNFKAGIIRKRKIENLWRQYYSTRNLLFILQRNRFYSALNYQILK
ncbi:hypothetical protein QWZ00_19230 [Belliella kenyensis]|uniref:hypothetical protein n=1 Tax=Belliella kenyensis TaxID=1472724 RepID=UPI0025B4B19C|nr:hypothetical protein [Belliella kenyensis]MDN3605257.1 hypothetical protein [Belliella kenyensis]